MRYAFHCISKLRVEAWVQRTTTVYITSLVSSFLRPEQTMDCLPRTIVNASDPHENGKELRQRKRELIFSKDKKKKNAIGVSDENIWKIMILLLPSAYKARPEQLRIFLCYIICNKHLTSLILLGFHIIPLCHGSSTVTLFVV